jgi:hypothetical protein
MNTVMWIIGTVLLFAFCCFVPPFKCLTACKINMFKRKWALKKLREITLFKIDGSFHSIKPHNMSYKELCRMYDWSKKFICNELTEERWIIDAREKIKHEIAEKSLLN